MKKGILTVCVVGILFFDFIGKVNAATIFLDDFEDEILDGWLSGTTGGRGGIGVTENNNSNMAYVSHRGLNSHTLSHDFNYTDNNFLSFDIQAVAVRHGGGNNVVLHAGSGVSVSFLDTWNQDLGTVRFTNVTSSSLLGTNDHYIDTNQHNYSASLYDYALLAGVTQFRQIAKVNLSFFSWASQHSYSGYTDLSSASVYFDNVKISSVPSPAAFWLFGSGLVGLATFRKRSTYQIL